MQRTLKAQGNSWIFFLGTFIVKLREYVKRTLEKSTIKIDLILGSIVIDQLFILGIKLILFVV